MQHVGDGPWIRREPVELQLSHYPDWFNYIWLDFSRPSAASESPATPPPHPRQLLSLSTPRTPVCKNNNYTCNINIDTLQHSTPPLTPADIAEILDINNILQFADSVHEGMQLAA